MFENNKIFILGFARRMVTESEYVGNSLDNLEKINCLIKR